MSMGVVLTEYQIRYWTPKYSAKTWKFLLKHTAITAQFSFEIFIYKNLRLSAIFPHKHTSTYTHAVRHTAHWMNEEKNWRRFDTNTLFFFIFYSLCQSAEKKINQHERRQKIIMNAAKTRTNIIFANVWKCVFSSFEWYNEIVVGF